MKTKTKIKIGLLASCAVSLSYMGFSPIIETLIQEFPNESQSLVQMVLTIPNLMFIIFSPLCGTLMLYLRKKSILVASICLYIVGGLFPFFFHANIWCLLAGSLLIGAGSGLMMPCLNGIICDYFEFDEQGTLMGLNACFVAIGAMVFIAASGFLSGFGWHYTYLVFLILIPVLILVLFILPRGEKPAKSENGKTGGFEKSWVIIAIFAIGFVYFMTQNAFNTNSSLLATEYHMPEGAPSLYTLINTIGGLAGGMLLGILAKVIKDQIVTVAVAVAAIGFVGAFLVPVFIPSLAFGGFVGFGFASFSAGGTLLVSKYTKQENKAFTIAIYNAITNLGAAISPYFINSLSGCFGNTVSIRFITSGIVLAVLAVISAVICAQFKNTVKK